MEINNTLHIYLEESLSLKKYIEIKDIKRIHYLKNVLRIKPKEDIIVFDKNGLKYLCEIEEINTKGILLEIQKELPSFQLFPLINIALSLIKRTKAMDELIDKLTQLGVNRIIPMITQRTIVKWDKDKQIRHINRWYKIAISSSQQSRRSYLPIIDNLKTLEEIIHEESDLKLILTVSENMVPIREVLLDKNNLKDILILVGPEGDFSPEEIRMAETKGFIGVSLGSNILRSDTAALSVVSFIRLYYANY